MGDLGVEIQDAKEVWVAWTNTDCTEGRGKQIPKAVCATKATALRLGENGYIQGSHCPVKKSMAVKVNNQWLVNGVIHEPSESDIAMQESLDRRAEAMQKAKAAGLTEEEIAFLSN